MGDGVARFWSLRGAANPITTEMVKSDGSVLGGHIGALSGTYSLTKIQLNFSLSSFSDAHSEICMSLSPLTSPIFTANG